MRPIPVSASILGLMTLLLPLGLQAESLTPVCENLTPQQCLEQAKGSGKPAESNLPVFRHVCASGNQEACTLAGWTLWNHPGDEKARKEAMAFFQQACDSNYGPGCTQWGLKLEELNKVQDGKKTVSGLFERACQLNDLLGCINRGMAFAMGTGGSDKKPYLASSFYLQACQGGEPTGCSLLGSVYDQGVGVEEDPVQANAYFLMACEGGDFSGCGLYGWNWTQGRGIEKNNTKGMRLLQVACDNGDAWSCKKQRKADPLKRRGIRPPAFRRSP